MAKPTIPLPTAAELQHLLASEPLFRLTGQVLAAYLVGSFAAGCQHPRSDVDVLLIVRPRRGFTPGQLTSHYRMPLAKALITRGISYPESERVGPQWAGRRLDVYFAYDHPTDDRPRTRLR